MTDTNKGNSCHDEGFVEQYVWCELSHGHSGEHQVIVKWKNYHEPRNTSEEM